MGTDLDNLVIGNFLLIKEEQKENLKEKYTNNMSWIKKISFMDSYILLNFI